MSDTQMLNKAPDATDKPGSKDDESLQALGKFLLDDQASLFSFNGAMEESKAQHNARKGKVHPNEALLKGESVQQRLIKVKAAQFPLLEAVAPLLRALSEMPAEIAHPEDVETLKDTLKKEINIFGVVCDEADISWKKMTIVRYCICTALDEAAHAMPWGIRSGWSQSNLLNHFEGDNDGGNKFFLLVGRLSMSANEYADVLEIMLRILGLGFEGRYSIIEGGERHLTKIRQRLITLVQSTREVLPPELSPHALHAHKIKRKLRFYIPHRLTLWLAIMLISSVFIWCKYHLAIRETAFETRLLAMHRGNLTKPVPKPRLRLAILLKKEIEKQLVTVDETPLLSKVIFRGDYMFMVGSARVRPEMDEILRRVAQEIKRVNGRVTVVGHTDSIPINKPEFANNQVLSEQRANDVASYLLKEGIRPEFIKTQGAGETQPVADNATPAGRAKNRRVEIFVNY